MHATHGPRHIILVMVILLAGAFAWHSDATRPAAKTTPSTMVTVDIRRVFDNLEEWAHLSSQLQSLAEDLEEERIARRQRLTNLEREVEMYEMGSEMRQEILQQRQLQALEYESFVDYSTYKIQRRKVRDFRDLYERVTASAGDLARANNYDIVFVDDGAGDIAEVQDENVMQELLLRRVLWADGELDITDMLIEHMNAAFDETAVR